MWTMLSPTHMSDSVLYAGQIVLSLPPPPNPGQPQGQRKGGALENEGIKVID